MNPNSYVNPQQLVNMCILNLSEKKKCKEKKSLVLSCLNFSFWIFVCFCLLFLCIDYYQWITVQKRCSECLPFTHFISRQKKKVTFFKTEIGGLVVCGYDGISVLLKRITSFTFFRHQIQKWKQELVTMFCPSSDMKFLSANHLADLGQMYIIEILLTCSCVL